MSQYIHTYRGGISKIHKSSVDREFIVDRTAKLSIHESGFVQLSGSGVLSGYDEITGMPRGIGLFTSRLSKANFSGPVFGFQCWGIEEGYEQLGNPRKADQHIILGKENHDFSERKVRESETANTYLLEFSIFPKEANKCVYYHNNQPIVDVQRNLYKYGHVRLANKVLDLRYFDGVLCVSLVLINTRFASESNCGYVLGSPGGTHIKGEEYNRDASYNFLLICPKPATFPVKDPESLSILECPQGMGGE